MRSVQLLTSLSGFFLLADLCVGKLATMLKTEKSSRSTSFITRSSRVTILSYETVLYGISSMAYMRQSDFQDVMKLFCGLPKGILTHLILILYESLLSIRARLISKARSADSHLE